MVNHPRIICVSNRLPLVASDESGTLEFQPSSGGLVTAMGPVLRKSRGTWIGWPGAVANSDSQVSDAIGVFSSQSECDLFPVFLDQNSVQGFYQGFSNQIIWPLFHDLQSRCNFEPGYWSTYLDVQTLFGETVVEHTTPPDLVWVHDFHLMGLGRVLRNSGMKNKICFFFHIPFPGLDIFSKLPWRTDVLESMLSYDLIGFQTSRDLKNFVSCVQSIMNVECSMKGEFIVIKGGGRECILRSFPISIDFNEFQDLANLPSVIAKAEVIRKDMNVEFLVFSIDRLDYTKGIPYRIRSFRRLLELEPALRRRIALLQVVVPSRTEVQEYQLLLSEIEQLVSQVNGSLGAPGWVPVHHLFQSLLREDLVAMYRAADVALVTPLKDGMNLVAKEYCASRVHEDGTLVLSEFAGVADELGSNSFLVNPYDIDGVARALGEALLLQKSEAHERMKKMREILRKADVFIWARSILNAVGWEWPSDEASPRPATVWDRFRRVTKVLEN